MKTVNIVHNKKDNNKKFRRAASVAAIIIALCVCSIIYAEHAFAAPKKEDAVPAVTGVEGGAFEVTKYDLDAKVSKNHSYDVEEKISVNIPDQLQRIDFAIPSGNFRISDIEVENTAYKARKASEASTVSIVDAEKLDKGAHTYTIRYHLSEYDDRDSSKDMFYFNVLLPEWRQPIGEVDISVSFPDDFPWDDMQCYSGQFGVPDAGSKISFKASKASRKVKVSGTLIPENYAITLKAQLPDGYWEDPLSGEWALAAVMGVMAAVTLVLALLWLIGGRDPRVKREKVTTPIDDLSPVELGYAFNSTVTIRDILHMIIQFAERGYLSISEYEPKKYRLYKGEEPVGEEKMFRNVYNILFEDVYKGRAVEMEDLGGRLELIMRSIVDDVASGFATSASSAFTPVSRTFRYIGAVILGSGLGVTNAISYFHDYMDPNYIESAVIAIAAAAVSLFLCREIDSRDSSSVAAGRFSVIAGGALLAVPVIYTAATVFRHTGSIALPLLVIVLAALSEFFIVIMRARGRENAELVSKIRSLRSFIYHPTPKDILENYLADRSYYYEMLIYALAFGGEESWAISFLTLDVPEPDWYRDEIEGHAFTNLRESPTTIDYARDIRSFLRTIENAYNEMIRRR